MDWKDDTHGRRDAGSFHTLYSAKWDRRCLTIHFLADAATKHRLAARTHIAGARSATEAAQVDFQAARPAKGRRWPAQGRRAGRWTADRRGPIRWDAVIPKPAKRLSAVSTVSASRQDPPTLTASPFSKHLAYPCLRLPVSLFQTVSNGSETGNVLKIRVNLATVSLFRDFPGRGLAFLIYGNASPIRSCSEDP